MKIYVVTQGEYSDYHIITATTDKNIAEQIAKKFNGSHSWNQTYIEEYEDAEMMLKPLYFIRFDKKGNVMECKFENSNYGYDEGSQKCRYDCNKNTFMYVTADTAEAAIKIGAERRAKFLAEQYGL